jgi:hypothetical protein
VVRVVLVFVVLFLVIRDLVDLVIVSLSAVRQLVPNS